MNISPVSYGVATYSQSLPSSVNPVAGDWKSLNSAFLQGNLTAAQSAFDSLQKNLASSPAGSPSQNSTVGQALSQLGSSLASGDITGAQGDFAALKVAVRGGDQHTQAVAAGVTSYNSGDISFSASSAGAYSPTVGTRFSAFA